MEEKKNHLPDKRKGDIAALACMLLLALTAFLVFYFSGGSRKGAEAVIFVDGAEKERCSLAENQTFTVLLEDGSYNLVLIEGGRVQVSDADCPDRLCVRQGAVSQNGESIICLPHKLVVFIDSPEESDMDTVTY